MKQFARPQALLWDLDGTIVDSEKLWDAAALELLNRFAVSITPQQKHEMIGLNLWDAADVLRGAGVRMSADEIVQYKANRVKQMYKELDVAWRPGARELLCAAAAAGIPNVMVTMSLRAIAQTVADLLPQNTFAAVLGGDEVTHGKPHPEPYLLGAQKAGVSISECMAFEDSKTGLTSASASGAVAVGVKHVHDLSAIAAHTVIDTLENVDIEQVCKIFTACRDKKPVLGGWQIN